MSYPLFPPVFAFYTSAAPAVTHLTPHSTPSPHRSWIQQGQAPHCYRHWPHEAPSQRQPALQARLPRGSPGESPCRRLVFEHTTLLAKIQSTVVFSLMSLSPFSCRPPSPAPCRAPPRPCPRNLFQVIAALDGPTKHCHPDGGPTWLLAGRCCRALYKRNLILTAARGTLSK
jgi:hypothetical protein